MVTHFVDLAVEMNVILPNDGPLRAEKCPSATMLIKMCALFSLLYMQ
jgi:hypothetical protein